MESSSIHQLSNKPEWYILKNGAHVGPFSQKNVTGYYEKGEVKGNTLLWKGGNVDWLPLSELKDFNFLFEQGEVLPTLPDIREIERLARIEIEKEYPRPVLKKTKRLSPHKKTDGENIAKKYKTLKPTNNQVSFESTLDIETSEVLETVSLPELPTFILPDLPVSNDEGADKYSDIVQSTNDTSVSINVDSEKEANTNTARSNSHKKIYQYGLVFFVALCFFVPSVYYFQQKSPLRINSDYLRPVQVKSLERLINSNLNGNINLAGAVDSKGSLHIAINSKSPTKIYGRVKSLPNQTTSLNEISFFVRAFSQNGHFNVGNIKIDNKDNAKLPMAGRYLVDFQVEKVDAWSKLIVNLKKVFILKELSFILNYKNRFRYSGEITLGQGSIDENNELIASYLNNRNKYVSLPVEYLTQQLKTLESIGERFKKLFFDSTTVKRLLQSKEIFSRKFGRELAPILQVITLSDLSEVELREDKLSHEFKEIFIHEFEKTKLISREISGLAAFVDKTFSEDGKWFSTRRIKQRKIINNEVKKVQNRINSSISALESLKSKFLIKI